MKISGKVLKYGNDVNTDVILPARYLSLTSLEDLAKHCMEDIDENFASTHSKGDIIIAGENFGCGSSREHAAIAIKSSGISCVVAKSFARIFFRNAVNIGLPILECPQAVEEIENGHIVELELETGTVHNITTGKSYQGLPFPTFICNILESGGLLNSIK